MSDLTSDALNLPPFPPLRWDDDRWEGEATLTAWAGDQCRRGPYGFRDSAEPSTGAVTVDVRSTEPAAVGRLSAAQVAAFEWLTANQAAARDAMLDALLAKYPEWRAQWAAAYGDAEALAEVMPAVTTPDGFRDLIGPSFVHVLEAERDGLAYVGYEFGCTWDDEHGLGFMTHRGRVVEIGGADTSFLEWIAERDAERP